MTSLALEWLTLPLSIYLVMLFSFWKASLAQLYPIPGIIQNADANIVSLVENLVLSHIKGNCLILVTLPMSGKSLVKFSHQGANLRVLYR